MNDLICALATPLQKGAVAIVRLSGDNCFEVVADICDIPLYKMEANKILYGHLYDGDELIDEALFSFFKAPKSYTAEDVVEINCHGSVLNARRVLNLCQRKGARLAQAGEFTRRAYLHGRIDLAQAEAINDLVSANNELQHKSALRSLDGSLARLLKPLLKNMSDCLAMIELNIDYPEYEDEKQMSAANILPKVREWIAFIAKLLNDSKRFVMVRNGIATAIVGKPNVGKSSLLNALLDKERAIVSDIEGTTRDLIEETIDLGIISLRLIDTAGIRESEDYVENLGIERSRKAIEEADLILLVLDGSCALDEEDFKLLKLTENKERIIVWNKSDLFENDLDGIHVSAKMRKVDELISYLQQRYEPEAALVDHDILINTRQLALLETAKEYLEDYVNKHEELPLDIIAENLYASYEQICDILGKEYREEMIDHLFKHFCVGK